jgi:hypothetical protein
MMAEFMYLFWNKGGKTAKWTPEEMKGHMQNWMTWTESLTKGGHLTGGQHLEDTGKVVRGPKKTVTDGPYAEAKDVVAGYLIVSAKDLDEAVELSKGCPVLEGDWMVEVRPIGKM